MKTGSLSFVKSWPVLLLLVGYAAFGQESLTDSRDGQVYGTIDISGTLWMTGNLNYASLLSSPMSVDQKNKQPNLTGRFYHVNELDSVCPSDWRLPDPEDWINYFDYLASIHPDKPQIKLLLNESVFSFHKYDQYIDLFSNSSPLKLLPTGRVEGTQFDLPDAYADYWTHDPPGFEEVLQGEKSGVVHVLPSVYEGKTHFHIRKNGFSNIHSHTHHLDPKKEKKLRKFMVRCVK